MLGDPRAAGFAELLSQIRVLQQPHDRGGERLGIGGIDEQSGLPVNDRFRNAAGLRADHRVAHRHRIEHGGSEAFRHRAHHEQVR